MVRPIQDGYVRPLTDAESSSGTFTDVGEDGVDFDGGGGSDPGGGGGVIVAPAAEALEVVPASGSAQTLDFTTANWWDITLTANCTLTITNPPASGSVGRLHVILRQGGSGGYTVTWPSEVEWPDTDGTSGGAAPTLFTAVDARDEIELITEDGGTSYGGTHGSATSVNAELNIEGGQSVIKAHGSMGSTETFDPTDGNVHTGTLNANCTFTLSAPTGSGACTLELWLTEDGTGGRTVTWPGSVTEQGTHDTTAGTISRVIVESIDGGTSWVATWIGSGTSFATPAIVLGTAAAAGAATTVIRSDSTIVAFDATVPVTQAFGDSAATGSAAYAARRDHKHGMPATPSSGGSSDHEHIDNIVFSGDGSTTVWELPAAPVDANAIRVFVTGSRSIAWVLSGTLLTTLTFDSAPASAANNIVIDIDAAVL